MTLKKIALAVGVAASLGLATGMAQSQTFPDFTVDSTQSGNTSGANTFVADKAVGGYVEVITFTATDMTSGTFTFALRWEAGQYFSNDGQTGLGAGTTGLDINHRLYALLTGSGSYTTSGSATTFTTGPGGTLQVYYDGLHDTTFDNPAGAPITDQATLFARTNAGDDLTLLASAVVLSGSGTLDPSLSTCGSGGGSGINCGSFGQTTQITLNADGSKYFTAPVPFYNLAFNSGQLNNFQVSGTQVINGSADLVFGRVPEPSALALVGIALVGLAATRRRRQG